MNDESPRWRCTLSLDLATDAPVPGEIRMNSVTVKRLGHICVGSVRVDALSQFYCRVFGCRVIHEFRNSAGECYGYILSTNGGSFLELFSDANAGDRGARFRHLCFEVDDIEKVCEQLNTLGYDVHVERGRTDKVLQCWLTDPDGNNVELHQYDRESVQFPYRVP